MHIHLILLNKLKRVLQEYSLWLPLCIIAIGCYLRTEQFLFNRSLWLDEAFIATSIAKGSIGSFFGPLEYGHFVPPGFSLVSRLFIVVFGNSDLTIRLFPYISSILSLFLFQKVARIYIAPKGQTVALLLFSLSESLIYYSSELKQYSVDVLVTLLLFLLAAYLQKDDFNRKKFLIGILTGAVSLWFSHPAIFTLTAIGIYLCLNCIIKRDYSRLKSISFVFCFWLLSFTLFYFLVLRKFENVCDKEWMLYWWGDRYHAFMPLSSFFASVRWLFYCSLKTLVNPGGFQSHYTVFVALALLYYGSISMVIKRDLKLFVLLGPFVLALIASGMKQYPIHGRLILFFLPSIILIISKGVTFQWLGKGTKSSQFVTAILTILLLICPLKNIFSSDFPKKIEELKPVFKYLEQNRKKGDLVYLYYWSEPAFRYYVTFYNFDLQNSNIISPKPKVIFDKELDCFRNKNVYKEALITETKCIPEYIFGRSENLEDCKLDFKLLNGHKRVWFIFSHCRKIDSYIKFISTLGVLKDSRFEYGASLFLFDFSKEGQLKKTLELCN